MPKPVRTFAVCLFLLLMSAAPAPAQSPESMAAAKNLMVVMHATDVFKTVLPHITMTMKPVIVQGRPNVEKAFDAVAPKLLAEMTLRYDELSDKIAGIYARKFSAAELKKIAAFYRSPTGQKLVQQQTSITQESTTLGQQFGRQVGNELRQRMKEELRKKGYEI